MLENVSIVVVFLKKHVYLYEYVSVDYQRTCSGFVSQLPSLIDPSHVLHLVLQEFVVTACFCFVLAYLSHVLHLVLQEFVVTWLCCVLAYFSHVLLVVFQEFVVTWLRCALAYWLLSITYCILFFRGLS